MNIIITSLIFILLGFWGFGACLLLDRHYHPCLHSAVRTGRRRRKNVQAHGLHTRVRPAGVAGDGTGRLPRAVGYFPEATRTSRIARDANLERHVSTGPDSGVASPGDSVGVDL